MAYIFSYDLECGDEASSDNRTRIRLIFERFGWQAIGGTCLRYPALGNQEQPEDLFGQVIPAMSLFRSLVSAKEINVKAYSWFANAESAYRQEEGIGHAILPVSELQFMPSQQSVSTQNRMSAKRMREALQVAEQALL